MAIILGFIDKVVFIQCSCMQYIRVKAIKKMPPCLVKSREDSLITNVQQSVQRKVLNKKIRPNSFQPPPLNTPSAIRKPLPPF